MPTRHRLDNGLTVLHEHQGAAHVVAWQIWVNVGGADETRSSLVDPVRLRAAARAIKVPTLLVRGRVSDLLSEDGARELLQLVPHAKLVDVAGAGHMVAGDRNDLFNDAVVAFLETVK